MKFGLCPVPDAEGAILAHSVALASGRLRKGTRLDAQAIAALTAEGLAEITVAQLEPGDLHEDTAAARIAQALVPDPGAAHLRIGPAATGRVNLFAQGPGVAQIDAARINALNAVHPMITVATVPAWQRMEPRGMVATIKVISYGVPEILVTLACDKAEGALRLRPLARGSADLIETTTQASPPSPKGADALRTRLERLGARLASHVICPHRIDPLAEALRSTQAEVICILTGSATSDISDVAPEALRQAGGEVLHFGMPVDPGNLLFIGDLKGRPVIGLPGCARSVAMNGADWVLERILCGVAVTPADIMGMGVGGLLKEIPQRGRLRDG